KGGRGLFGQIPIAARYRWPGNAQLAFLPCLDFTAVSVYDLPLTMRAELADRVWLGPIGRDRIGDFVKVANVVFSGPVEVVIARMPNQLLEGAEVAHRKDFSSEQDPPKRRVVIPRQVAELHQHAQD